MKSCNHQPWQIPLWRGLCWKQHSSWAQGANSELQNWIAQLWHDTLTAQELTKGCHRSPGAAMASYLQHQVKVSYFLCRPPTVVISNLKPRLHTLNVWTFLEEILIGIIILQQVLQEEETVFHHYAWWESNTQSIKLCHMETSEVVHTLRTF